MRRSRGKSGDGMMDERARPSFRRPSDWLLDVGAYRATVMIDVCSLRRRNLRTRFVVVVRIATAASRHLISLAVPLFGHYDVFVHRRKSSEVVSSSREDEGDENEWGMRLMLRHQEIDGMTHRALAKYAMMTELKNSWINIKLISKAYYEKRHNENYIVCDKTSPNDLFLKPSGSIELWRLSDETQWETRGMR